MSTQISQQTTAISRAAPMLPYRAEIVSIQPEAPLVSTYWLRFLDPELRESFQFQPGQFNMLTVPGMGEAAISISSDPKDHQKVGHTIRFVGNVTNAISRLNVGDVIGVRGPFGTSWPLEQHVGRDIFISAGGIGLPPLRPVLYQIMARRSEFGRVVVIYGARTPADLQFTKEYKSWEDAGIELIVTVDRGDDQWTGLVGVVPLMFYRLRMDPHNSVVYTCGPEIMIRFVIFEALARRIPISSIYVSMERNMRCGLGLCGHCQIGPYFVCKDGPVFSYEQLQPYFNVEDL
jgi:NAD(P)H-flavin reductase